MIWICVVDSLIHGPGSLLNQQDGKTACEVLAREVIEPFYGFVLWSLYVRSSPKSSLSKVSWSYFHELHEGTTVCCGCLVISETRSHSVLCTGRKASAQTLVSHG